MVVLAISCLLTSFRAGALEPDYWISAGPVRRSGGRIQINGSSHVQTEGLRAAKSYDYRPDGGGNTKEYDERTYEDGYVRTDPGTDNDGMTWYWGYRSSSQRHGDELHFHNTGYKQSVETIRNDPVYSDARGLSTHGAFISGGCGLWQAGRINIGVASGIQAIWGLESSLRCQPYEERYTKERYEVVHVYDVGDIDMPGAGHEGTEDGPFDTPPVIPSPLIDNRPDDVRRQVRSREVWSAVNEVSLDAQADSYELWLGPRIQCQIWRGLQVHATPNISLNAADLRATRTEQFRAEYANGTRAVLQSWDESANMLGWVWGAGLAVGAGWECYNGIFGGIEGRYAWVSGDIAMEIGPNHVSVNPTGFDVMAAVGFRFGARRLASANVNSDFRISDPISTEGSAASAGSQAPTSGGRGPDMPTQTPFVPQTAANPRVPPVSDTAKGEQAYRLLIEVARATKNKETVRHVALTMKKYEPEEFAALVEYCRRRNSERTSVAGR